MTWRYLMIYQILMMMYWDFNCGATAYSTKSPESRNLRKEEFSLGENLKEPLPMLSPIPESGESEDCHILIKTVRRVSGRCKKLGGTTIGCVSKDYVDPFSSDCGMNS